MNGPCEKYDSTYLPVLVQGAFVKLILVESMKMVMLTTLTQSALREMVSLDLLFYDWDIFEYPKHTLSYRLLQSLNIQL